MEKKCWKNGDKKRFTAVAVAFVGICTRGSIQWHVKKWENNAHTLARSIHSSAKTDHHEIF